MASSNTNSDSKSPAQALTFLQLIQLVLLLAVVAGLVGTHFQQKQIAAELVTKNGALAELQALTHALKSDQEKSAHDAAAATQALNKVLTELSRREDTAKLDESLKALGKTLAAKNQSQTEALLHVAQAGDKRMEVLTAQVASKPQTQPMRWAYLNEFELRDAARQIMKPVPLKAEENPETNPELAKKLAEYNNLQQKLQRSHMGFPTSEAMRQQSGRTQTTAKKDEDLDTINLRVAELKVTLMPYLDQNSSRQQDEATMVKEAIRKACEGKYDIVLDKTFGDDQLLYKTPQPVPDITEEVIDILTKLRRVE